MWPFRHKKTRYGAGEEVQFLLDHGWRRVGNGLWSHKDHPRIVDFEYAMMAAQVMLETHQAKNQYRRNASLYDPDSFIGRIIKAFRFIFRIK